MLMLMPPVLKLQCSVRRGFLCDLPSSPFGCCNITLFKFTFDMWPPIDKLESAKYSGALPIAQAQ
jgi:hypothetical protein